MVCVTIHTDHPFATPEGDRDPLRRFRGRMPAPVSVFTTGSGRAREGWTISSFLVSEGDPDQLLALLDADSDLADALAVADDPVRVSVNLLSHADRHLADAFARVSPAPGGPFTLGDWTDTEWGPRLTTASAWLGATLTAAPTATVGWAQLLLGRVDEVELGEGAAMAHLRGRYTDLTNPTNEGETR